MLSAAPCSGIAVLRRTRCQERHQAPRSTHRLPPVGEHVGGWCSVPLFFTSPPGPARPLRKMLTVSRHVQLVLLRLMPLCVCVQLEFATGRYQPRHKVTKLTPIHIQNDRRRTALRPEGGNAGQHPTAARLVSARGYGRGGSAGVSDRVCWSRRAADRACGHHPLWRSSEERGGAWAWRATGIDHCRWGSTPAPAQHPRPAHHAISGLAA